MTTPTTPQAKSRRWRPRNKALLALALVTLLAAGGWYLFAGGEAAGPSRGTTFRVARGPLEVTVLEGGSVAAQKSLQLKSEVQGQTKILSIVEEGYFVTPDDVANGLVLVELDSKELMDRATEQELAFQNALASVTKAREDYQIQKTMNQNDVSEAELRAKFGLMDFEKYLGQQVASEIRGLTDVESRVLSAPMDMEDDAEQGGPDEGESRVEMTPKQESLTEGIDFTRYASDDLLGDGEARQALRAKQNAYVLAQQELGTATSQMNGTRKLFEKDFVTKTDVEKDELALQRAQINLASAETARDLFIKYEFPKTSEKLFSDYVEGLRKLEVARRAAASKMAQVTATLKSTEAQFELQSRKKRELQEQIAKCVMRATQPGLVVYGDGNTDAWRDSDRIEEGAIVRERQIIITIPDTTIMTVEVKVHESQVKSVALGQKARIVVDAFPARPLTGEVTKIGVLPDSQNRWMNPDLKVYNTTVRIDGTQDWLKPGMTAETEILVKKLDDVVQVPLQAVTPTDEGHVVYVQTATGARPQKVETGEFNNTFIEVKSGLEPGQTVLLRSPDSSGTKQDGESQKGQQEKKSDDDGGGDAEQAAA